MTSRFDLRPTPISGLVLLERKPQGDSRGYLERMFCTNDLRPLLAGRHVVQINHTLTARRGTVRGLHFQYPPHAEMKLVACLKGEIFDVAVDLRRGSSTFLAWHAEILSAENHRTLVIPEGFAHGFQTLADDVEMLYLHSAAYEPATEGALNVRDPRLGVAWPLAITGLSPRDAAYPALGTAFEGLMV